MQPAIEQLIFLVLGFFIISIMAVQMIEVILNIIFIPRFGFKISFVSFFGLVFMKQEEKWKISLNGLSYLCQCNIMHDISKPVSEDSEKKERQASYLVKVSVLLISLFTAFMCSDCFLKLFHGGTASLLDIFIVSFVTGMVVHSITHFGICVYTYKTIMKRLGGYVNTIGKKMCQGYSFEELNLRPIEELPYKNVSQTEKLLYYNFYVYYLVATGQTEKLPEISHEMTYLLEYSEFIVQQTGLYYWLIYYYSRYEINSERADKFLKKVWPVLSEDSDANAKRVLAYYYYGIQRDREKARKYLKEGLDCVGDFSYGAERDLERKLLQELAEALII